MTYEVEAAKATHEALEIVGHSEEPLLPARLPLDLGLNSGLHTVQHTRHCRKDTGLQCCHIICHFLDISLHHTVDTLGHTVDTLGLVLLNEDQGCRKKKVATNASLCC